MSKIPLVGTTFQVIPEGLHQFRIDAVSYKEDFGKLEITMVSEAGLKHIERYNLMGDNGKPNDKAMSAFSFFARAALNDMSRDEVDPDELVGHFIEAEVKHDTLESNKTPGKMLTFVRLENKAPCAGFGGAATSAPKANNGDIDLAALLG